MLVDSHCHLDFPDFESDLDGIVSRAKSSGVGHMLTICTRVRKFGRCCRRGALRGSDLLIGTHPHYATEERDVSAGEIIEHARHPRVVAIGEVGLDYFYQKSSREDQEAGFRTHIAAARETGLPLVIHTRDADEDAARILREEMARGAFRRSCIAIREGGSWRRPLSNSGSSSRFRDPHLSEVGRAAGACCLAASRQAAGRNGRALPRASALSRQAERAVLCAANRKGAGRCERRKRSGDREHHDGEFLQALCEGESGGGWSARQWRGMISASP